MNKAFYHSQITHSLDNWTLINIKEKNDIFTGSTLEKENKLPYWVNLSKEEIKQYIKTQEIFQKLKNELIQTNINNKNKLKL